MDFGRRPPEFNSAHLYSGPGSDLLTIAAATWDTLADTLDQAAAGYATAIGQLGRGCHGPAATVRDLAHHRQWLQALADQARQTAHGAEAASSAYEAAFTATVPPPTVEANRTRRASLAAMNFLGNSSAEIADTEAEYEQMWAQNAAAMYAYAAASADAAALTPFVPPPAHPCGPSTASRAWRLKAAPEVVAAGGQVMSAIPEGLAGLSRSPLSSLDASLLPVTASLSKLSSLSAPLDVAIRNLNSLNKAAALRRLIPAPGDTAGTTVAARIGHGASVGFLTVPRAWTEPEATTRGPSQPLRQGRVGEPIRLVAENDPPGQPSRRRPS